MGWWFACGGWLEVQGAENTGWAGGGGGGYPPFPHLLYETLSKCIHSLFTPGKNQVSSC